MSPTIIRPAIQAQFDRFVQNGRVFFISAPCGFGKTVLAEALLADQDVCRLSADDSSFALPAELTQRFLLPLLFCVVGEAVMAGVYLTHAALYEGLVQKIMDIFDISTRFSGLTDGMLDVTAIVYFLSVIAAGIFLSIQSIQKRRWS